MHVPVQSMIPDPEAVTITETYSGSVTGKARDELIVISVLLPPTRAAEYPMETLGLKAITSIALIEVIHLKRFNDPPVLSTKQYIILTQNY